METLSSNIVSFLNDKTISTAVFEVGGSHGLDFLSFNSLFETFMGSVSQNIMNMSRIQCSMHVDFQNYESLVYLQSSKPVWYQKTVGVPSFGVQGKNINCWYLSPSRPCTTFPSVRPKKVSLQRQWRFPYKNTFTYVLVQSHSGASKNQALCSLPKYWFRLEVNKGDNEISSENASILIQNIFMKLKDVVCHKIAKDEIQNLQPKTAVQGNVMSVQEI